MTTQLLFYCKVDAVNKDRHQDLYVETGKDYSFTQDINAVPLTAVEFQSAAREYPIVFAENQDNVVPAVILGTSKNENLFFSETGGWQGKYIPAFVRRYPFIFSSSEDGKTLTLCIDEDFSGCNKEGKGERLFDFDGEHTQYLKNVLKFLEKYQAHFRQTKVFCQKLIEFELLVPITAQFSLAEDEHHSLNGMYGINRDKLNYLTSDQLSNLAQTDSLELVFLHLQSLRNFSSMQEKARAI